MSNIRPKIAFVATTITPLKAFMVPHLRELGQWYDLTIYGNVKDDTGNNLQELLEGIPISVQHVAFERKISPWRDMTSWWRLFRLLRSDPPLVLHSIMPKTGLIGMTSGFAAGIPIRVHMYTGQVWANRSGLVRLFLKWLDKMTGKAATHVLADSHAQRLFLLENGFRKDLQVLANGSVAGVDTDKFTGSPENRKMVRTRHGISENAILFGFLGRMNYEKGVADLIRAFAQARLGPDTQLLLVGPDEDGMATLVESLAPEVQKRVHFVGHTNQPQHYLAALDVFCLPSYREGGGLAAIEAAACGVPTLVSKIYGLADAVEDGVSGLTHPPGDIARIAEQLERLADDADLRRKLGENGRRRAESMFKECKLVEAMSGFYSSLTGIDHSVANRSTKVSSEP